MTAKSRSRYRLSANTLAETMTMVLGGDGPLKSWRAGRRQQGLDSSNALRNAHIPSRVLRPLLQQRPIARIDMRRPVRRADGTEGQSHKYVRNARS